MKIRYSELVSLGAVLLVAGCGGGGSSGGDGGATIPTTPVEITTTNAQTVAKGAMGPAQDMAKSGGNYAGAIDGVAVATGVVSQPSGLSHSLLDLSLSKFAQARDMQLAPAAGPVGVIAGSPMTSPCAVSGTETINAQDVNNNAKLDAGDVLTMSFSNCNDGYSTENGSMTFAVSSLSAAGTMPLTTVFTLTFNQYSNKVNATGATETVNGDINFSTSNNGTDTTGTMSGTSISMTSSVDGAFRMTNYNFSFTEANTPTTTTPYSFSATATTASTFAGGSITIATPTAFTGVGSGNPTAGVMVITGANGGTLTLTARSDGTHVGLAFDDDGTGPHSPQALADTTWAAL